MSPRENVGASVDVADGELFGTGSAGVRRECSVTSADKEAAEIAVIEAYLPQAASAEEIADAVAQAIAETGASSMKDMGMVMKATLAKFQGKTADGKAVSEAVKARLT